MDRNRNVRRKNCLGLAIDALEPRRLMSATLFAAPVTIATGSSPADVVTADVNGDGNVDLLVACAGTTAANRGFAVHLGDGAGGFGTGTRVATANAPKGIVVGDFNEDGKVDVAVAGTIALPLIGTVEVFRGAGDGTFGAATTYQVGLDVAAITTADVNVDGHVDLITTSPASQKVNVFAGRGDGTFDAAQATTILGQPGSTAVGDFDEDGKPDLVVNTLANVTLLRGVGDGTFGAATPIYSFTQALALQVVRPYAADLNADGHQDVVVPQLAGGVVQLIGRGDGTFAAPQSSALSLPTGMQANRGLTADFNHDGIVDAATLDYAGGKLVVDAAATTAAAATRAVYTIGASPSSLVLADLNGDRKLDLIATNSADGTLSVLLSTALATVNGLLDRVTGKLTILGTDGDDTITLATRGTQLVVTRAGIPDLFALADVRSIYVNAGSGDDLIDFSTLARSVDVSGGYGNDTILAGSGDDSLFGSMGNDVLDGGDGADRVGGWKGKDTLFGGAGEDRMYGGDGNDLMEGQSGRDRMWGEAGNDIIAGGQSNDRLYGGDGDDTLNGSIGNDLLNGGAGRDLADVRAGDLVDSIEIVVK